MRVLVVDQSAERGEALRAALRSAGYEVASALDSPVALLKAIEELEPDVVVVDVASPSRDVLEQLTAVMRHAPRPIVMFAADDSSGAIRVATRAGVCAYVVDGLQRKNIKAIVDAAAARFEEFQALRTRLAEANLKLSERKVVEKAKGLLMKRRGLDEDAAYAALRKMAMDRSLKLAEVARSVIEAADILGA
jgi:response regulator NasT